MTAPGIFEGTGMPAPGWWDALWPKPAEVLSAVGVRSGTDVVDLCSGDGWFTLAIARLARRVIAIDLDATLLATARMRLAEGGLTNCSFAQADAYDVAKVVSDPVDHVFLANVFHGVPDRPRLSKAVESVLKPAGLLAIVNWHARPRAETTILGEPRGPATELRMAPQATIAAVEPCGFKLRNLVEVGPYHYGAVFEHRT
ncbi:MAG TPA: class I SAM-dependent methyltransferase [Candidatus Angelobacter sp.]|nr:class I SAM-dependent methyltransferase [Candidatus Angelobacter sp.]